MVDKFKIEDAIKIDEILLDTVNIISIENYFKEYARIDLNERKKELFLNGVKLTFELNDGIYRIYSNNTFLGIGVVNDKLLKRDVIL